MFMMEINFGLRPDTVEFHLLVEGDFSVVVLFFETEGDCLEGVLPLSGLEVDLLLFSLLSARGLDLILLLEVTVLFLLLDDDPDAKSFPKELPIQERRVSALRGAPAFRFVDLGDFSVMFLLNSDKSGDLVKLQRPGDTDRIADDLEEGEGGGEGSGSEETVSVNSGRSSSSPDNLSFAF